ncbi:UDP-N-acetylmuramate--L-alanine ligase [Hydrogenibacillus schlegelii]|uniref:UDP-N-acetylmuramate--L-alanine ligase n=1 Tax=Hydrogenibacillus schlegelii TaxID=1484 RepID=A0A179IQG7_HYDSH|nr:UDP-N-acetylmuramate--L-alanine ligase [Hydrogenibacillus schlegelii]OAR04918.1 hypothetical protein SA87_04345 [Hydrogenibacillus schlegelii]
MKIHFIGIGGTGMSALASVYLGRGAEVSGSDLREKPVLGALRAAGARIFIGHAEAHVPPEATVVYSSDVPPDNVELAAARRRGQPVVHRSDLLAHLLNAGYGIAVAGSHGKTTTTAMIAYVLERADRSPTAVIGGEVVGWESGGRAGQSSIVVAEADESDGSFLRYHPAMTVITNIEPDHLENFDGDFEALKRAFLRFAKNTRLGGTVVLGVDDPEVLSLYEAVKKRKKRRRLRFVTFGAHWADVTVAEGAEVRLEDGRASFGLELFGEPVGEVRLQVIGAHHVMNALAAAAALRVLGVPASAIVEGLSAFPGVKRRFERLGEVDGALVVDDYAVHPTEIRATLAAARALRRRVIAVFQPHRKARVYYLWQEFVRAFDDADLIYVTDVYAPKGDRAPEAVSAEALAGEIARESGRPTFYLPDRSAILAALRAALRPGDVVVTLGAGDVRAVGEALARGRREG